MRCPVDQAEMLMSERQGVEIDYCPTCRGIWLDRGELDKILDRPLDDGRVHGPSSGSAAYGRPSAGAAYGQPSPVPTYGQPAYGQPEYADRYRDQDRHRGREDDRYDDGRRDHGDPRYGRRKRRESWLGELFDF